MKRGGMGAILTRPGPISANFGTVWAPFRQVE